MRLIDAEELLEDVRQQIDFLYSFEIDELVECGRIIHNGIIQEIEKMPTIDAEPVRHGHWDDTRVAFFRKCSECGATVKNNLPDVFLDCDIRDLHYCSNCGAKMDEETT